jgi:hypothetical protein
MPQCIHAPSNVQLCNSNKSTCGHIILWEVRLSWRGVRDRGRGGTTSPPLNTCRPSIKGYTYKSIIIHTHTLDQSIISKVTIEKTKNKRTNENVNILLHNVTDEILKAKNNNVCQNLICIQYDVQ